MENNLFKANQSKKGNSKFKIGKTPDTRFILFHMEMDDARKEQALDKAFDEIVKATDKNEEN